MWIGKKGGTPEAAGKTSVLRRRLRPSLRHPSYLVLDQRRRLLEKEIAALEQAERNGLLLVDVGGHEKPYQPVFAPVVRTYLALDLGTRTADVAGRGEELPFGDASVDLVLCTQVLEHVQRPAEIVDEILRILKPGGIAYVSVPAVFPLHGGPEDNWRFMSGGLRLLLAGFREVRVVAEGGSVAGFFRTLNMYLWVFTGRRWTRPLRGLMLNTLFPLNNLLGRHLDALLKAGDQFAVSWLGVAVK